jgi:ferredoxin-NADP reductase
MTNLTLKVASRSDETAAVRRIDFVTADGRALPGYQAGAHIGLELPGVGLRKYSLINTTVGADATRAPQSYRLGVRLEPDGGGGSRAIHALNVGDVISAEAPKNDFALKVSDTRVLLLGGGIGVTPLMTMAAELKAAARPFRLVYAVRSQADAAFIDDIRALAGAHVTLHDDAACGHVLDIASLFASLIDNETVYACGPKPMLKAAIQAARKQAWPAGRLTFELFYSAAPVVAS